MKNARNRTAAKKNEQRHEQILTTIQGRRNHQGNKAKLNHQAEATTQEYIHQCLTTAMDRSLQSKDKWLKHP